MVLALMCVLGVGMAEYSMQYWYTNNDCLGPSNYIQTWGDVLAGSSPNCTNLVENGTPSSYYVSSTSTTCDVAAGYTRVSHYMDSSCTTETASAPYNIGAGCHPVALKKRGGGSSGMLSCDNAAFQPRPYVTVTLTGGCGVEAPVPRSSAQYSAIFSNAVAGQCVVYYNQTDSQTTYAKLASVCTGSGTVSFSIYSDDACTTSIGDYSNAVVGTCTTVGSSAYTIECVAPAGTPPSSDASSSSALISFALVAIALFASVAL